MNGRQSGNGPEAFQIAARPYRLKNRSKSASGPGTPPAQLPMASSLPNTASLLTAASGNFPRTGFHFPHPGIHFPHPGFYFPHPGFYFPCTGFHFPHPGFYFPDPGFHFPDPGFYFPHTGIHYPDRGFHFPDRDFPARGKGRDKKISPACDRMAAILSPGGNNPRLWFPWRRIKAGSLFLCGRRG
jgi:hypothetical protein